MQPRLLRSLSAALAVALLAALLTYAWRGTYTRYVTDDYCSAAKLRNLGFAGAMQWHWTQWSGRYSYYAIKAIPESIGPATAPVMPALLIALFSACAVWAMRRAAGPGLVPILCGLAVVFATIDATPDVLSAFGPLLWETGALTYMLPLVLYALWLGLFFAPRSLAARCALGAVVMLVAGGLSETSLAAQLGLAGGMLFLTATNVGRGFSPPPPGVGGLKPRPTSRVIALVGFLTTIAAAVITAAAPGNVKRMSGYTTQAPLDALAETFRLAYRYVGSNVFVDGVSLIVVLACGFLLGSTRTRDDLRTTSLLALTAFGAFIASILPSAWVLSGSPPPRALHVTGFFFAGMLLAIAAAIGMLAPRLTRIAAPLLLVVSIGIAAASIVRVAHTIDDGRRHAAEVDRIDALLRASAGKDVVMRAPLARAERLVFADPSHWTNRCLCDYHGVRSLRVTR